MRTDFPEVIDSSMRGAWRSDPRRFYWTYIREIVPDGENVHLHAGASFARGLEVSRTNFFTGTSSYDDAVLDGAQALLKNWGSFNPGEDAPKQIDRVLGAYEFYHSLYRMPLDQVQPLMTPKGPAVEFNFVLPIPGTRHPTTGNPVLYAGRFDMLGRKGDTLFIVDEKTTSQLGQSWVDQWKIRAQFTGYAWGARQFGHEVAGAIIRGISILKYDYGNAESIVYRKDWQIDSWLENLRREVADMIVAWREWRETGNLHAWQQSLDSACSQYGGCPYLRLCDMPDDVVEKYIPIYYKDHHWDPTKRQH